VRGRQARRRRWPSNVAIQDLAITNAKAQGGGGAGLRGAIFVANLANVTR